MPNFVALGINQFEKDSAAAILVDGKVVAAAEEERFSRVKHDGSFPSRAIEFCLKTAGVELEQVHLVLGPIDHSRLFARFGRTVVPAPPIELEFKPRKRPDYKFGMHHLWHAAASFRQSGFERAAVLTVDAMGDDDSAVGFLFEGRDVERIASVPWRKLSFGRVYAAITELLGFGEHGQGKLMGLAPYGEPFPNWREILDVQGFDRVYSAMLADKTHKFWKLYRRPGEELRDEHLALAASVQLALEEALLALVRDLLTRTGVSKLCLGGGVHLNCAANGRIWRESGIEALYLHPAAADPGTAVGMVLEAWADYSDRFERVETAYLGPEFSESEIEAALLKAKETWGIEFERCSNPAREAAALIAKRNAVVGWFQGRMEWGPRALGNRSILADPREVKNWKRVNNLKGREPWRPLAPSVLDEFGAEVFEDYTYSPFMLLGFPVRQPWRTRVPAVVHVDGTARPQSVKESTNPRFYELLQEFYRLTGVPMVLNTSFNHAGEPIVATPSQAIESARKMGLDALFIEGFCVRFQKEYARLRSLPKVRVPQTAKLPYALEHSLRFLVLRSDEPETANEVGFLPVGTQPTEVLRWTTRLAKTLVDASALRFESAFWRWVEHEFPNHTAFWIPLVSSAAAVRMVQLVRAGRLGTIQRLHYNRSGRRLVPERESSFAIQPVWSALVGYATPALVLIARLTGGLPDKAELLKLSALPANERLLLEYKGLPELRFDLAHNPNAPFRERLIVVGTKGVLELVRFGTDETVLLLKANPDDEGERLKLPAGDPHELALVELLNDNVRHGFAVSLTEIQSGFGFVKQILNRHFATKRPILERRLEGSKHRIEVNDSLFEAATTLAESLGVNLTLAEPLRQSVVENTQNLAHRFAAIEPLFARLPELLVTESIVEVAKLDNVPIPTANRLLKRYEQQGLAVSSSSPYGLELRTMRRRSGKEFTTLFLSRAKPLAQKAADLDSNSDRRGYEQLQRMLGAPRCCAKFAAEAAFDANAGAFFKPLVKLWSDEVGNALLNNFLPYRLLQFFPCSYSCPAASQVADAVLSLLKREAQRLGVVSELNEVLNLLGWSVMFFDFFRVLLFEPVGTTCQDRLEYKTVLPLQAFHHPDERNPIYTDPTYTAFADVLTTLFRRGNVLEFTPVGFNVCLDDKILAKFERQDPELPPWVISFRVQQA